MRIELWKCFFFKSMMQFAASPKAVFYRSEHGAVGVVLSSNKRWCVCRTFRLLELGILESIRIQKFSFEISMGFTLAMIYVFLFLSNGVRIRCEPFIIPDSEFIFYRFLSNDALFVLTHFSCVGVQISLLKD